MAAQQNNLNIMMDKLQVVLVAGQFVGGPIVIILFGIAMLVLAFILAAILAFRNIMLYIFTFSAAYAFVTTQTRNRWEAIKRPASTGLGLLALKPAIAGIIYVGTLIGSDTTAGASAAQVVATMTTSLLVLLAAILAWPTLIGGTGLAVGGLTAAHAARHELHNRSRLAPTARSVATGIGMQKAGMMFSKGGGAGGSGAGAATRAGAVGGASGGAAPRPPTFASGAPKAGANPATAGAAKAGAAGAGAGGGAAAAGAAGAGATGGASLVAGAVIGAAQTAASVPVNAAKTGANVATSTPSAVTTPAPHEIFHRHPRTQPPTR
jgi:hypothetical protein